MSPSILQHLAFKVFFCLCCIGLFSVPSYTNVTPHRDDYPNEIQDPARLKLVLRPLRLESFGARRSSCHIPENETAKIGIKIWLHKVDWSPPLYVFTQARIYQPRESYNFNESDVYVNPKKAHLPIKTSLDIRLFFTKGNTPRPHLSYFQYSQNPWRRYGQDVYSKTQGQIWTKKNQLFNITFANCGYRFIFRMDSICDRNYFTNKCNVYCRRNLPRVTDCNHNDGMVCETGFHSVPSKKFFLSHGARRTILSWSKECNKQNTRIAIIENGDEQATATSLVREANTATVIGIIRKHGDYNVFVDYVTNKTVTYTYWYGGEPNDIPHGTKCVKVQPGGFNGKWNDDYCSAYGALCQHRRTKCVETNECNITPPLCQNDGSCINTVGSYRCTCPNHVTGKHCENVNECTKFPGTCKNDGTCTDTVGSYRCDCPTYATGVHCEHLNECTKFPGTCKNDGTCTDTVGSYRCDCPTYATGEHCEHLNECTKSPGICKNDGTCTDTVGSYSCDCPTYATGKHCEVLNECTKDPGICKNNGTCTDTVESYRCDCRGLFNGKNCELDVCEQMNCQNGGTCVKTKWGEIVCLCPDEFAGSHCEDLNECVKYPHICENAGVCTNLIGTFRCWCPGDNCGRRCEL